MDINEKIEKNEAKKFLNESHNRLINENLNAFVYLNNINKIYPNGTQAVFDFNLEIKDKEFICFVGPSGCGKSTTLRMIAGLEEISSGELFIDKVYSNYLPSKDRDIAMVFQSYALYPQMSVFDNIAFGLKIRHIDKKIITERVYKAADILDLGPYLDRKPKELSGGQMQRVALGRAIVRNAKLFLMDEPLSNLDAKLRVQMRSEIVRIHEQIGATTIYVTHDQTEAMTMATKIAVMSKGWVQQIGKPEEIYHNPKNIFVATFIGAPAMNILNGNYENGIITLNNGFELKLNPAFKQIHDNFYEKRIAECERMLEQDDFKKMHALKIYEEMIKLSFDNQKKIVLEKIKELKDIASTITDLGKAIMDNLDKVNETTSHSEYNKAMHEVKRLLLQINNISSSDLGKLHNAQVFSNKKTKKNDDIFYQKKKKSAKKKKNSISFRVNNLTFSNNLYDVCVNLLNQYKKALEGKHEIKIGIRPENIHLDNEFIGKTKSNTFVVNADVVELMGSELLIHSNWNNAEFISKISTGTLVKPHTDVSLVLDIAKLHLFDVNCGDTIQ